MVSVPVLHWSSISFFFWNLGLMFLLSLVSFLRFKRPAHSPYPWSSVVRFCAVPWGGGGGVPSSFDFLWSPYGHVDFSCLSHK